MSYSHPDSLIEPQWLAAHLSNSSYLVGMPIVIACLMAFGIVRFIGIGTQNKSLYIFGGTALVAGMTMKQLGQVRGARKRLGG